MGYRYTYRVAVVFNVLFVIVSVLLVMYRYSSNYGVHVRSLSSEVQVKEHQNSPDIININTAQAEEFTRKLLSDPTRYMDEDADHSDIIVGNVSSHLKGISRNKCADGSTARRMYVVRHAERISLVIDHWHHLAFNGNGEIIINMYSHAFVRVDLYTHIFSRADIISYPLSMS